MPLGWKLVIDSTNAAALADFWAAALEYEVEDPSALISQLQVTSPRREVPERQSGNNRLHIDVHSEPEGLDELVTRLEKLGATRIREVDEGPAGRWWVMQDPEGNEFCAA